MKEKIIFCWSSGKDSSLALYDLLNSGKYEIVTLLTTICEDTARTSHHYVPEILIEKQAESIGIPLKKVYVYSGIDNTEYGVRMKNTLVPYMNQGVEKVAFGDIFLEDLREYRENNLAKINMKALFPLWKQDSKKIAKRFIELDFKAIITSVNNNVLDESFVGRIIDEKFLADLPDNIDPCGENGEYHSFAFDGPIFKHSINYFLDSQIIKSDYDYCNLLPA